MGELMASLDTAQPASDHSTPLSHDEILGPHPEDHHVFGEWLSCNDGVCQTGNTLHRALMENGVRSGSVCKEISHWLATHHLSAQRLASLKRRAEIYQKYGLPAPPLAGAGVVPKADKVRKGNLAEIMLAKYCCVCANADLPVYRLHYSTNVNQSMPGDDVLAFDLDSEPVRVIVGEAKFRATPSKVVVKETVNSLCRSYRDAVPLSINFVADRLREQGKSDLADRVDECYVLCESRQARVDYVGLLVSNCNCAANVARHGESDLHRLLMVSLSLSDPVGFADECWDGV